MVLPADDAEVPANLPALSYQPAGNTGTAGFELMNEDGSPVAVTFQRAPTGPFLVVPDQPLTPGRRYRVRYPGAAPGCSPGSPPVREQVLRVGPASPLPAALGEPRATGQRFETLSVWASVSCFAHVTAALAHVVVTPTTEAARYAALTVLEGWVGSTRLDLRNVRSLSPEGKIEFDLFAACAWRDDRAERGLPPGRHTVELRAHVVGAPAPLPPVTAQIDLSCACSPPAPTTFPDAGGQDLRDAGYASPGAVCFDADGGGHDATAAMPPPDVHPTADAVEAPVPAVATDARAPVEPPPVDAGPPSRAAGGGTPAPRRGGCALAGTAPAPGGIPLFGAVAALCLRFRRRSSRPNRLRGPLPLRSGIGSGTVDSVNRSSRRSVCWAVVMYDDDQVRVCRE